MLKGANGSEDFKASILEDVYNAIRYSRIVTAVAFHSFVENLIQSPPPLEFSGTNLSFGLFFFFAQK